MTSKLCTAIVVGALSVATPTLAQRAVSRGAAGPAVGTAVPRGGGPVFGPGFGYRGFGYPGFGFALGFYYGYPWGWGYPWAWGYPYGPYGYAAWAYPATYPYGPYGY